MSSSGDKAHIPDPSSNVCYPDTVGCRRLTIPRIAAAAEDTVTFRTGRKRMMALDKKGSRPC